MSRIDLIKEAYGKYYQHFFYLGMDEFGFSLFDEEGYWIEFYNIESNKEGTKWRPISLNKLK
jgi:hypothetical protein